MSHRCKRRSSPVREEVPRPSGQHARSRAPSSARSGKAPGRKTGADFRVQAPGSIKGQMLFDGVSHQLPDIDPGETSEWLDAFDDVIDARGRARARPLASIT